MRQERAGKPNHRRPWRPAAVGLFVLVSGQFAIPSVCAAEGFDRPMRFEHLTLEDGLSQSNVMAVLQDSSGLMWFGTENGLNSYNGYEFTHYRRERGNLDALAGDFVSDIKEDEDGDLWIATNGAGLSVRNRATGKFKTFRHDPMDANSLPSNIVRRLLIDPEGMIWIGTRGGGLGRFDPRAETFMRFDLGDGDNGIDGTVFAFYREPSGVIWVGGDHGLARIKTAGNTVTLSPMDLPGADSLPDVSVRALAPARGGGLWIGTYGGGLFRMTETADSFERFVHNPHDSMTLSGNEVSSIIEDRDGRLWVGTTEGLNLVDQRSGAVTRYTSDSSDPSTLGSDDVSTIYQDRAGLLWIGTKTHGISKWNPATWTYGFQSAREITADGESQPSITAFVEGLDGTLWLGTFGDGLNAVDAENGSVTRFRKDADRDHWIADDRVMSLMRDRNGRIWAGTTDAGIAVIDPGNRDRWSYRYRAGDPNSLSANGIMTMYEDHAGYVWVGTFGGGISRFDPGTERFLRFVNDLSDRFSLSSDRVTSFAEGKDGRMWVGTDGGGLNLFDPETGRFHSYRNNPSDPSTLASDTVYSIAVDSSGTVWVGTQGGGLDRVVSAGALPADISFDNVSQLDGLANDVIYGVQVDKASRLWLSTNYGISAYDPRTGEISNIGRKDGLQSDEFNFGAHYKSDSGRLYFGGGHGFNAFDPAAIGRRGVAPQIVLTELFKTGRRATADGPINPQDGIDLGWKDDVITFELAAMDFAAPESNRYMYMLEGFDRNWMDLGTRRSVTYTDLDKGSYLLRVRAASAEGVWSDAAFEMPVRVGAAPWDTWWAYLCYGLLFAAVTAALWVGHLKRIRREEEYSRQLERQVIARTNTLLERNEQLRVLNKALQESSLSDPLTGLRNRRFVFEEVSRDLDVIRRRLESDSDDSTDIDRPEIVFMMIDLDNFKPVNDTYGHAVGDKMLIELRDVLLGICRRSDYVIRWGGDEFVVITKITGLREAQGLAERIRSAIAAHAFTLDDGLVMRTTCSIGFAAYPLHRPETDSSGLDQIISLADALMYEAKRKRDAWVGMLSASEATGSFKVDIDSIESVIALFGAQPQEGSCVSEVEDNAPVASPAACIAG
ncbi:MAG TPA: two-component regulator propeller domain-containing protein [Gammaproteobacteria bacterium]